MIWRIEWDKTIDFIIYTEKLDRFAKFIDERRIGPERGCHRQKNFLAKADSAPLLYSVFDALSEKKGFKDRKKSKMKKIAYFEK